MSIVNLNNTYTVNLLLKYFWLWTYLNLLSLWLKNGNLNLFNLVYILSNLINPFKNFASYTVYVINLLFHLSASFILFFHIIFQFYNISSYFFFVRRIICIIEYFIWIKFLHCKLTFENIIIFSYSFLFSHVLEIFSFSLLKLLVY